MGLAILQNELVEPTVEQLTAAFEALPTLTRQDARARARDAVGLLAKHLEEDEAHALLDALARQGIAAAIVEDDELAELGAPYRIKQATPTAQRLDVMDAMNHPVSIAWESVTCIAAGLIGRSEIKVEKKIRRVHTVGGFHSIPVQERHTTHSHSMQPIAEVYLNQEPYRLRINAKEFRFGYLAGNMPRGLNERFDRLVIDLATYAPHATINRGVDAIVRDQKRRKYRSMQVFEREVIWLHWLTRSIV